MLQNGTKSIVDQISGGGGGAPSKSATDIILRRLCALLLLNCFCYENHAVLDNKNETEKLRIVSRLESFGIQFAIVAVYTLCHFTPKKHCILYTVQWDNGIKRIWLIKKKNIRRFCLELNFWFF